MLSSKINGLNLHSPQGSGVESSDQFEQMYVEENYSQVNQYLGEITKIFR